MEGWTDGPSEQLTDRVTRRSNLPEKDNRKVCHSGVGWSSGKEWELVGIAILEVVEKGW